MTLRRAGARLERQRVQRANLRARSDLPRGHLVPADARKAIKRGRHREALSRSAPHAPHDTMEVSVLDVGRQNQPGERIDAETALAWGLVDEIRSGDGFGSAR